MHDAPVGGRLSLFPVAWRNLTPDCWIWRVISQGYKMPFTRPPPTTSSPVHPFSHYSASDRIVIQQEIQELLRKRAIEEVPPNSRGFRSQLFTVPKKTGDLRPVLNLKPLNQYLPRRPFKMESLKTACTMINPGDYCTKIDLADAFMHYLIHPSQRHYLQFPFMGRLLQYHVLPYGLAHSPLVFTKGLRPVMR